MTDFLQSCRSDAGISVDALNAMLNHHKLCPCTSQEKTFRENLDYLLKEIVEISEVRTLEKFLDEASDVAWAFNALVDRVIIPFEDLHLKKCQERVRLTGCARSSRHRGCR
jgi:hypothetical protein